MSPNSGAAPPVAAAAPAGAAVPAAGALPGQTGMKPAGAPAAAAPAG